MVTFIEILNRLTADEIKILEYIVSPSNNVTIPELTDEEAKKYGLDKNIKIINLSGSLPITDIKRETEGQTGYSVLRKNFNCIGECIKLDAPENVNSYIDNMISLGLIERKHNFTFAVDKIYHYLENHSEVLKIKSELESNPKIKIKLGNGRIDMTDLGNELLSLCSNENV